MPAESKKEENKKDKKKKSKKKKEEQQHLELIARARKYKILTLGPLLSCVEALAMLEGVSYPDREGDEHTNC